MYPTHIIIESYLYKGWPKSKKRMMTKNISRTLTVIACVVLVVSLKKKIDKFLSIVGAVTCTPIAFILPGAFHLKICAKTTSQKVLDSTIVVFSTLTMFFCTYKSIADWNV